MLDKKGYCCKICEKGKAYAATLLAEYDSIFDAAEEFEAFYKGCEYKCPYKDARDWENPDGVEWWKLQGIEEHSYGEPKKLLGTILSIKRYKHWIETGLINPYDGHGYYCTEDTILTKSSDYSVKAVDKKINQNYKYVLWYNR